jgi:hypothetical protein
MNPVLMAALIGDRSVLTGRRTPVGRGGHTDAYASNLLPSRMVIFGHGARAAIYRAVFGELPVLVERESLSTTTRACLAAAHSSTLVWKLCIWREASGTRAPAHQLLLVSNQPCRPFGIVLWQPTVLPDGEAQAADVAMHHGSLHGLQGLASTTDDPQRHRRAQAPGGLSSRVLGWVKAGAALQRLLGA